MTAACVSSVFSLYNAKVFYIPDCRFLNLPCKPVKVAYAHTLLETASCLCHSWSLEPVTWQKEIALVFQRRGRESHLHSKNRPQIEGKQNYAATKGDKHEAKCILDMLGIRMKSCLSLFMVLLTFILGFV